MNQIERLVNIGFKRSNAEDICMWYMAMKSEEALKLFVKSQEDIVKKWSDEE